MRTSLCATEAVTPHLLLRGPQPCLTLPTATTLLFQVLPASGETAEVSCPPGLQQVSTHGGGLQRGAVCRVRSFREGCQGTPLPQLPSHRGVACRPLPDPAGWYHGLESSLWPPGQRGAGGRAGLPHCLVVLPPSLFMSGSPRRPLHPAPSPHLPAERLPSSAAWRGPGLGAGLGQTLRCQLGAHCPASAPF